MKSPLALYPTAPTHTPAPKHKKLVSLADLQSGEEARILRVAIDDSLCRRRLAELGIAEGMLICVTGEGDTMMLAMGASRFGLARSCAQRIQVMRKA